MSRKYRETDLPIRGQQAGRMFDDTSLIEVGIELRRQLILAEQQRRLIERLRAEEVGGA